jgi:hypothetical protein
MSGSFGQLRPIGSLKLFLQAFAGPANHHCVSYKGNVEQMNFVLQVTRLVEGLCVLWLQGAGFCTPAISLRHVPLLILL